jgi:two-component system CheB/CheR fusion protein
MQSANEEVLSANEELQSTNEELDTAKEELQSTNEELNTVNEELHGRNEELSRLNSDLVNLLSSVQIAIVIVASDLRIRRFTPMAERVLNLIPTDVGRPISHIKPNIDCPNLEELITTVIDTVTPREQDVHDAQGNLFSLRIRPYKNLENRIDGAVLALFDQQGGGTRVSAEDVAIALAEMFDAPLVLLDGRLHVRHANRAFLDACGMTASELHNQPFLEVADGRWNRPALHTLLEAASDGGGPPAGEGDGRPVAAAARRLGDGGLIALTLKADALSRE